jgi:hypothetical protein
MTITSLERYKGLKSETTNIRRQLHISRGGLRFSRPHVLDADADEKLADLKTNEAFRRLPSEHARVRREIRAELETPRRKAAGVALFQLKAAEDHIREWSAWIDARRRDVEVLFEDALVSVTPDGMIMLRLYREQRRATLAQASIAELRQAYVHALEGPRLAADLVDASLIEERVEAGLAPTSAEERAAAIALRELIDTSQEARLPVELPDLDELSKDIARLRERASALHLAPINPDHDFDAAKVYRDLEAAMLTAGQPTDQEDLQAVAKAATA